MNSKKRDDLISLISSVIFMVSSFCICCAEDANTRFYVTFGIMSVISFIIAIVFSNRG